MSADCVVGLPVVRVVLDAPGSIADRAKQELFPGGPDYTLPNLKRRGMFASAAPIRFKRVSRVLAVMTGRTRPAG